MRLLLTVLLFGAVACSCENRLLADVASPDGRRRVVGFERNCGATTPRNLHVSILMSGERTTASGNLLVVDGGQNATLSHSDLGSLVRLAWLAPNELHISYDDRLRVFKQNRAIDGIRVTYQEFRADTTRLQHLNKLMDLGPNTAVRVVRHQWLPTGGDVGGTDGSPLAGTCIDSRWEVYTDGNGSLP